MNLPRKHELKFYDSLLRQIRIDSKGVDEVEVGEVVVEIEINSKTSGAFVHSDLQAIKVIVSLITRIV